LKNLTILAEDLRYPVPRNHFPFSGGNMLRESRKKILEVFRRICCWFDGEPYTSGSKTAAEEFTHKILLELKRVMQRERFCFQEGKELFPTKYAVLISEEDNAEWYGIKRQTLERALTQYLDERIRPVALKNTLMPRDFSVVIQVNRRLQKGEIIVLHQWEKQDSEVEVFVRSQPQIYKTDFCASSEETTKVRSEKSDEETVVRCAGRRLFCLEIWRDGICQKIIPIYQTEFTVGRGSENIVVDIPLKGDAEISRLHAVFRRNDDGHCQLTVKGKNPITVEAQKLYAGQTKGITFGESIGIGCYQLRLQS
jgi:hypothetical protein